MNKRPEAMTEQDKLLDIQLKLSERTRALDLTAIVLSLIFVFAFALAIYIIPDKDFSEQENRYLQKFPEFTIKRLVDGDFTSDIADYFSDQFPLRDFFVGMKGVAEIAQLKTENNSVTLGSAGYIIKRADYPSEEAIAKNFEAASAFASKMNELGVGFTMAIAGRGVDVLQNQLPMLYPNDISDEIWEYVDSLGAALPVSGATKFQSTVPSYVDLRDALRGRTAQGMPLYYRTDHHWTTMGAFFAYCELAGRLGIDPPSTDDYRVETASDAFYGTTWSSAGMKWIKPDTIQYYRYDGDESYITHIVDTDTTFSGFYDRSYLEKKDKYSSFIGGNNARVDIYKVDAAGNRIPNRPKLLLIKDSFAHSLAPFLARDYDLVLLDLRYYKKSTRELVESEAISQTLILMNLETLSDSAILGILQLKLG